MKITKKIVEMYPSLRKALGQEVYLAISNILPEPDSDDKVLFFGDLDYPMDVTTNTDRNSEYRRYYVNKLKHAMSMYAVRASYMILSTKNGLHIVGLSPMTADNVEWIYYSMRKVLCKAHIGYYYVNDESILRISLKENEQFQVEACEIEPGTEISLPHLNIYREIHPGIDDFFDAWEFKHGDIKHNDWGIRFVVYPRGENRKIFDLLHCGAEITQEQLQKEWSNALDVKE